MWDCIIWFINFILRYINIRNENVFLYKNVYINIFKNFIYDSLKWEKFKFIVEKVFLYLLKWACDIF